jgi:predicted transcriptional regulator
MEERNPQLEDELEQFRTKENFSNYMKKYFEKKEEVDSLNTELANVRKTLQAKIDDLTSDIIYAYDDMISLRLQIDGMQHVENSENPNQVRINHTIL